MCDLCNLEHIPDLHCHGQGRQTHLLMQLAEPEAELALDRIKEMASDSIATDLRARMRRARQRKSTERPRRGPRGPYKKPASPPSGRACSGWQVRGARARGRRRASRGALRPRSTQRASSIQEHNEKAAAPRRRALRPLHNDASRQAGHRPGEGPEGARQDPVDAEGQFRGSGRGSVAHHQRRAVQEMLPGLVSGTRSRRPGRAQDRRPEASGELDHGSARVPAEWSGQKRGDGWRDAVRALSEQGRPGGRNRDGLPRAHECQRHSCVGRREGRLGQLQRALLEVRVRPLHLSPGEGCRYLHRDAPQGSATVAVFFLHRQLRPEA